MRIFEWVKIIGIKRLDGDYHRTYSLTINDVNTPKTVVRVNKLNSDTYRQLRQFKTPRYDVIYLLRRQKTFTTAMFKQHYDVVVCDRNFKVLKTLIDIETGYISEYFANGYFVYFAVVGTINHFGIDLGARMRISRNWIKF